MQLPFGIGGQACPCMRDACLPGNCKGAGMRLSACIRKRARKRSDLPRARAESRSAGNCGHREGVGQGRGSHAVRTPCRHARERAIATVGTDRAVTHPFRRQASGSTPARRRKLHAFSFRRHSAPAKACFRMPAGETHAKGQRLSAFSGLKSKPKPKSTNFGLSTGARPVQRPKSLI
jgi:hypothetical protein